MEDGDTQYPTIANAIPHWKTVNGRLPPDSLLQVWARLPLNTLYKCRSVCKLWKSAISSDPLLPNIRHRLNFLFPSPPNLLLFLHFPNVPLKVPEQPVLLSTLTVEDVVTRVCDPEPHPIRNGFTPHSDRSLDLLPSKGPVVCFVSEGYFYLCNPSTQEFLRIARGHSYGCAFGYLRSDNRYVLTRLSENGRCEFLEFGPGSAGSASWRAVKPICPFRVRGFGVMVDRAFYWTIDHGKVEIGSTPNEFLLCLDTKDEKFSVLPPPEGNDDEVILYDLLYLVEFRGSLCAVDNKSRPSRMEIWVLTRTECEFAWVRNYNIFISGMERGLVYPFCDFEGENGREMVLCNGDTRRLYLYNLKKRRIKIILRDKNRTINRIAVYNPGPFPLSFAK